MTAILAGPDLPLVSNNCYTVLQVLFKFVTEIFKPLRYMKLGLAEVLICQLSP